jgi:transcriptional regulator of aromatic amino acid metabolism
VQERDVAQGAPVRKHVDGAKHAASEFACLEEPVVSEPWTGSITGRALLKKRCHPPRRRIEQRHSPHELAQHLSVNCRQTEVPTAVMVGQALMAKAQEAEKGGEQVVDAGAFFNDQSPGSGMQRD